MWPDSLCASCNGCRSSSFDGAFDRFELFVISSFSDILRSQRLAWGDVFGVEFEQDIENLKRYFLKQMGCALASCNIEVPIDLVRFLNFEECSFDVRISCAIDLRLLAVHLSASGGVPSWEPLCYLERSGLGVNDTFSYFDYRYTIGCFRFGIEALRRSTLEPSVFSNSLELSVMPFLASDVAGLINDLQGLGGDV